MTKNRNRKNKNKSSNGQDVSNVQCFRWTGSATAASNIANVLLTFTSTAPDRFATMCNIYRYLKPISLRVKTISMPTSNGLAACEVIPGSTTTAPAALTNFESNNMQSAPAGPNSTSGANGVFTSFKNPPMDIQLNSRELHPLGTWLDMSGVGTSDEEQIFNIYWFLPGATDVVNYHVEFKCIFRCPMEATTDTLLARLPRSSLKSVIKQAKSLLENTDPGK